MQKNRKRKNELKIFLSDDELDFLNKKITESGVTNKSAYVRKMIMDGCIINVDFTSITEMNYEIHKIGVNINQIAKQLNSMMGINETQINSLESDLKEIIRLQQKTLMSIQSKLN